MQRLVAVGLFLILTVFASMLVIGHGPWAGEPFWELDSTHGLNTGDVPVLALWLAGAVGCTLLWQRARVAESSRGPPG